MNVLVTGAAGFLGTRVIERLLSSRSGPLRIVAADLQACSIEDERIHTRTGSIADAAFVRSIVDDDVDIVYHLAAILSGEAEAEFDLGMRVNVDATRLLLDACRRARTSPRFIFTSSLAVFGGALQDVVPDDFILLPQSSYGAEKAIGEMLVTEYSRRGFIDGIVCRLPTISVRPGKPNAAASSFVSGIIREPLTGSDSVCPVPLHTRLWISSPDVAVRNLIRAASVPAGALESRRALNLPGITVTAGGMLESLERLAGPAARARVRCAEDPRIADIVCSWPGAFDVSRAESLGFERDRDFDAIVRQFQDELALQNDEPSHGDATSCHSEPSHHDGPSRHDEPSHHDGPSRHDEPSQHDWLSGRDELPRDRRSGDPR